MKTLRHLHRDFDRPEWTAWFDDLPCLVANLPKSQLLQAGRNHVYRTEHLGQNIVVKHFQNHGLWKKLVYRMTSGKARRSYDHSMALIEAGIPSPQPIGWREDWSGGFLYESFYVCAWVDVASTAREIRRNPEIDWAPRVADIARMTARMHDAGIHHLDLNGGNVLFVGDTPETWGIQLIDNNRMRFGKVTLLHGIQSLLQLSLPEVHRERWIETYTRAREWNPQDGIRIYQRIINRHKLKWRIKNITRPWRRKLGL